MYWFFLVFLIGKIFIRLKVVGEWDIGLGKLVFLLEVVSFIYFSLILECLNCFLY